MGLHGLLQGYIYLYILKYVQEEKAFLFKYFYEILHEIINKQALICKLMFKDLQLLCCV
jgi:hypothetical protein